MTRTGGVRQLPAMAIDPTDPVALTQALVRCASVTPQDDGAIAILETLLADAGFETTRVDRGGIANLFARWGHGRTIGFNGHTDVVPAGNPDAWTHPPFAATISDNILFGRGAVDMKSGVAAFVAAAIEVTREAPTGSIVLTITGDEEGDARDGTIAILDWMSDRGERMDACLVGEPTCPETMGDMMKIGRRGSMSAYLTATGIQGHSAYPHRARNPLPVLVAILHTLASRTLDDGTAHFDPSTLALTTIDTGNPASNVLPGAATATVNIRFNDAHSSASLSAWITDTIERATAGTGVDVDVRFQVAGESFLTPPGALSALVADAVEAETGQRPVASTSGGTSDARFIKDHCPVVEFGLVGQTMHQVDERAPVDEIRTLKSIYARIIRGYLA